MYFFSKITQLKPYFISKSKFMHVIKSPITHRINIFNIQNNAFFNPLKTISAAFNMQLFNIITAIIYTKRIVFEYDSYGNCLPIF